MPISNARSHASLPRMFTAMALAVLLAIGALVFASPTVASAAVPEVRLKLPRVTVDTNAFYGIFSAAGSSVVANLERTGDGGTTWTETGLPVNSVGRTRLSMRTMDGHMFGYTSDWTTPAVYHSTDYDIATQAFVVSPAVLPGIPLSMSDTMMTYRAPDGTYMAYDYVHATPAVALTPPSGVADVVSSVSLVGPNGILWSAVSADSQRLLAYAASTSSTPGPWTALPNSYWVAGSTLRYTTLSGALSFCSVPLIDLTAAPVCTVVDAADHSTVTTTSRDYGSWSLVSVTTIETGGHLYIWSADGITPVPLPPNTSVLSMSVGDTAHLQLSGTPRSMIRVNPDGSLGVPLGWPTKALSPSSTLVAPDRVVILGTGYAATAMSMAVSGSGFGSQTVLPRKGTSIGVTAGRTAILGGDGTSTYDRGDLAATLPATQGSLDVSGPYIASGSPRAIWTADGQAIQTPTHITQDFFGSRALSGWSMGNAATDPFRLLIDDLTGAELTRSLDLPGTGSCYSLYAWGDLVTVGCRDKVLRVFSMSTGALVARRGTATVDQLDPVAIGDGYVIYLDSTTKSYGMWRVSDDTTTPLGDCLAGLAPSTDGVGHVVCASATELIWRDFSYLATSAGRVLGWLAPTYFSSGLWTPQVDLTKPFAAGSLRIRRGSTVIKDIPVPASADGSLRGVSWDGTTTAGAPAPTGEYVAELIVSGADASGPVRALDGVSAPTFQLAWTGPGATVGLPGSFVPLSPSRLLDTRITPGAVPANGALDIQVTGQGGIPTTGVGAVLLNVTAVTPAAPGYLTVYPAGATVPNASNLNFVAGQVVPNLVLAKIGTGGRVTIRNSSIGTTHVAADVAGYFLGGPVVDPGGVAAVSPARLIDTRVSGELPGVGEVTVKATGRGGVPESGVSAVIVNLTAASPSMPGFLTAYPTGAPRPNVSNVNFHGGETVPNLAFVKLGPDGTFTVYNHAWTPTPVVVDVVGYVVSGLATGSGMYVPLSPKRVLDSRPAYGGSGPVGANSSQPLTMVGVAGVPTVGVSGVVVNLTAVATTGGFLTVYPADSGVPTASNVNFGAGQVVANLAAVKTSAAGTIAIRNSSPGANNVIVDVSGYFTA